MRPDSAQSTWPGVGGLASAAQIALMEQVVNGTFGQPKKFNKVCARIHLWAHAAPCAVWGGVRAPHSVPSSI